MALILYGSIETWLTRTAASGGIKSRFCAAWLCPEEFSRERVFQLQQDGASGQPERALVEIKRALILDSASAYRWADMGEALLQIHKADAAKYCFQQAVALAPNSPAILFRAANLYFTVQEYPKTLRYLSAILKNPDLSEYEIPAFLTYARMGIPISEVLDKGIPQDSAAAKSFLRFLMEGGQLGDAETTWRWISQRSLGDSKVAGEYIGFLIRNKRMEEAAETWAKWNSSSAPDYLQKNWSFNGSFDISPQPCLLDWTIESTDDVQANRSTDLAYEGRWSLKLIFAGKENVDFHRVFQDAVVKAGKWRARAFIKTDGLTTDQGISVRIYDLAQPRYLDIATDPLTGTHDWTLVERKFEIGAKTPLVRVEITRKPTFRMDNKISGTAWVDSVALSPAP